MKEGARMRNPLIAYFRDVDKAVDTRSDLNKGAEIGQAGDLAADDFSFLESQALIP